MARRTGFLSIATLLIAALAITGSLYAEHPSEHPVSKKQAGLTKEDLAVAIQSYVTEDAALKGGFFLVYDDAAKEALLLTLDKVHKERLSSVGHDQYFACADFTAPDGRVFDLDIFMEGPDKDNLEVTDISVHKVNGKARYTWSEKDGIWNQMKS